MCIRDSIDRARAFYADVLALDEIERPPEIAAKFRSAWYRIGGSELHVVENADFEPLDSPLGPHIAVSTDDFHATVARIQATGAAFQFGPGKGPDGIQRAVLTDPTGNVFEITEAPPLP